MSQGRTFAIGDIHGCDVALETLLGGIQPRTEDLVVVLGDVIDRGAGTARCIDLLLDLRTRCRVVHLLGNHEEMFFDAMHGGEWSRAWPSYGGLEMLESYGGGFEAIPDAHLDFLRSAKEYFETEREIFVHGLVRPHVPVDQEESKYLRWARFDPTLSAHISGKRVICGHTAQKRGVPAVTPHYVCIDTCAYCETGYLSVLDVDRDLLWRASQISGELLGPDPLSSFATR